MKVIQKGNYKPLPWKTKKECLGDWWQNNKPACHSLLEVEETDIVKRVDAWIGDDTDFCYGFVCPECHCFTVIHEYSIPDDVQRKCLRVADKSSPEYKTLTEAEKALSVRLFGEI